MEGINRLQRDLARADSVLSHEETPGTIRSQVESQINEIGAQIQYVREVVFNGGGKNCREEVPT
jgi:hypothetical protein